MMSHLARICIFPIKSLDGVEVDRAVLLEGGALVGDREFAILDERGNFVNGKRSDRVHQLRTFYDLNSRIVRISVEKTNEYSQFHLDKERELLAAWLSDYFGYAVSIAQNLKMGFPDDTNAPGPTIVSTETLKTIVDWFPELNLEEVRRRFRTNLEIDGVPAFWEDRLFTDEGQFVPFQIGDVNFLGSNPCQRCVVITRNTQTGESYPKFQKQFILKRKETLPSWANSSRFNHFYRLTINTRVATSEVNKQLKIGDAIAT
jgi:uncharacterized protein